MRRPDIILVDGPSSAGKTTLCRALQAAIEDPYLVTGFDDFIFMAPPRYYRGADTGRPAEHDAFTALGVEMVTTSPPGAPPSVTARFGPVFRRLLDSVRALADESCRKAFAGLDVFAVGVTCPIDILEERERERGDRVLGRARGLAGMVHGFLDYDVMVDTGALTPAACVSDILAAVEKT